MTAFPDRLRATVKGIGRASGKVILVGEHFVVHGGAALAMPLLAASIEVAVVPGEGGMTLACPGVVGLERALDAMLTELGLDRGNLDLTVRGDLPLAAGLGGSAALATALVRALGAAADEVEALVARLERLAHGRPSGIDGAVVSRGRPIWFEAGHGEAVHVDSAWSTAPSWWVAVVAREGSTREAVARVAAYRDREPHAFELALGASNEAARALRALFLVPPRPAAELEVGEILDAAHARLMALGVSNAALDALVVTARGAGAFGAKLTGAGLGGAVIAIAPSGLDLEPAFRAAGAREVIGPHALAGR